MPESTPLQPYVRVPLDPADYLDISASPEGPIAEQVDQLMAGRGLKMMFYNWDQVQAALDAGAPSVEAAKRGLRAAFVELEISCGRPLMSLFDATGHRRGEIEFVFFQENPQAQIWDSGSELEVAELVMNFLPRPA